jgi:hypothetical protein
MCQGADLVEAGANLLGDRDVTAQQVGRALEIACLQGIEDR